MAEFNKDIQQECLLWTPKKFSRFISATEPTVAVVSSDWRKAIGSNDIIELPRQDEPGITVELWGYDPMLLNEKDIPLVDRLSLFVMQRDPKRTHAEGTWKPFRGSIMVKGIELFASHFKGFENSYVLIGGSACDLWMQTQGLPFRATKDLDIVIVTL
jgi:hypothetical protein